MNIIIFQARRFNGIEISTFNEGDESEDISYADRKPQEDSKQNEISIEVNEVLTYIIKGMMNT